MDSGAGWAMLNIVGPLVLAVLLWALLRNRKSRPDRTEQDTRALYHEEEAARKREDGDVTTDPACDE